MTTLIVTASSKSKTSSTSKDYKYPKRTFANSLNEEYKTQLLESRQKVISDHNISEGPDITEGDISESNDKFLPAYIRYTGRTYSKITNAAWNELNKSDDFDCVIVSALYGIIRYNEPIRDYVIEQKDKMKSNTRIMTFWKNSGAKEWLLDYIKTHDFDDVKFVLSTSYSKIVQRDKLIEELNNNLDINAEDKQHKSAGRASMLRRGEYINNLLLGKD